MTTTPPPAITTHTQQLHSVSCRARPTGVQISTPPMVSCETWDKLLHFSVSQDVQMIRSKVSSRIQVCPTLCKPMDYSPPGSSVHGILQARILQWVALLSSKGSSQSSCNTGDAGDAGLIPGLRRSPGRGHDNPHQYYCLDNPMNRGAWWTIVHGVAKSWTQLNN